MFSHDFVVRQSPGLFLLLKQHTEPYQTSSDQASLNSRLKVINNVPSKGFRKEVIATIIIYMVIVEMCASGMRRTEQNGC
jgi:hypothetical protein